MARRILQRWFKPTIPGNPYRVGPLICLLLLSSGLLEVRPACQLSSVARGRPNSASAVSEYVGSTACAPCHQEIYKSYAQTAMGRSMSVVTPDWLKSHKTYGTVEDTNNHVTLEVHAADGKLFQTEYQLGPDGR